MLELKGRTVTKSVPPEPGKTLLELAQQHGIDFGFSCLRGTCGRCRCQVAEGMALLNRVTDEEWERLDDDELDAGYRLACQAAVREAGAIKAVHKPYF